MKKRNWMLVVILIGMLVSLACGGTSAVPPPTATKEVEVMPTEREPTATPSLMPTEEGQSESAYLLQTVDVLEEYGEDADFMLVLFSMAEEDPLLFQDPDYLSTTRVGLDQFLDTNTKLRRLAPPPQWVGYHRHLLRAAEHIDLFCDLYWRGLVNLDVDLGLQAFDELELGTLEMDLAKDLLQ